MEVPQSLVGSADEEGDGDEERDQRALEEEIESPFLEPIQLALTVCAALDPRLALVLQVIGQA